MSSVFLKCVVLVHLAYSFSSRNPEQLAEAFSQSPVTLVQKAGISVQSRRRESIVLQSSLDPQNGDKDIVEGETKQKGILQSITKEGSVDYPALNGSHETSLTAYDEDKFAMMSDPVEPITFPNSEETSVDYDKTYALFASTSIGVLSGFSVALFKLSIEALREVVYGTSLGEHLPVALIPALGGITVGILTLFGEFSPGLRGAVNEIDSLSINTKEDERFRDASRFFRKPLAAIATLGTGNSLGPEGPSVEIGMTMSRLVIPKAQGKSSSPEYVAARIRRNRLLLSAGAAAGVSAGFNAPLAGAFFALEIVQQGQPPVQLQPASAETGETTQQQKQQEYMSSGTDSITSILIASVLSALISQVYIGESLALSVPSYELKTPLVELPLYLLLGVASGIVAGTFSFLAQFFKGFFDGEVGPNDIQEAMKLVPKWMKPVIGAVICGLISIVYPQILFFGYETINTLLAKNTMSIDLVLTLLAVKTFTTALSAGSGLVGGTFAPSLFLGGMLGAAFHNVIANLFSVAHASAFELSDVQAYAIVGAAGVLAALFRAPLTGSLLLFELTRDYDVLLPVLASAGVGSVMGDIVEKAFEEKRRDRDSVSWGDLSDKESEFDYQDGRKS